VELWTRFNSLKQGGIVGFCEHDDNDDDDAVTAANVERRLSIMTIMLRVL
jgi:hypothetical protein